MCFFFGLVIVHVMLLLGIECYPTVSCVCFDGALVVLGICVGKSYVGSLPLFVVCFLVFLSLFFVSCLCVAFFWFLLLFFSVFFLSSFFFEFCFGLFLVSGFVLVGFGF